ncbi:MAG: MFS transporter [Proteobacteria bacterium]|nr:MFS transporter [Pseudomonadota bacterium]
MNKKKLWLWCLYDFANSFVQGNFLLYFSRWMVVEGGLSDLYFNLIFVFAAIFMLFVAPRLAAKTDKHGGLIRHLTSSTMGIVFFMSLAALFPLFGWNVYLGALCYLVGFLCYQLSFVFFNPLLNDIADEKHRGRASGYTQAANAIGMVFGLIAFAPFAKTNIGALLPSIMGFLLLAMPIMIFYKEPEKVGRPVEDSEKIDFKKFRKLFAVPGVAAALLSFFFFNDALVTMANNLSIYTKQIFDATEKMTIVMVVGIQVMSAVGAIIGGFIGDKVGLRKVLIISLIAWIILLPIFALANDFKAAVIAASALGLFFGAIWNTSRAYASTVIPKKDLAYGFSFFTIFERLSSIMGPLTWGLIVAITGSYRMALGALSIFVLCGLFSMFINRENKKIA